MSALDLGYQSVCGGHLIAIMVMPSRTSDKQESRSFEDAFASFVEDKKIFQKPELRFTDGGQI